ncbi:Uncharacterized protein TCM_012559 [Theobroma cacao]|uniref:Uncharacterized protein n=1 Tax=Theobroma cacao TaxID=3641 RepID=A0A061FUL1_THECC|nr:Uncharacterized protein TCM_012559 [Theobroma cacao]
MMPILAISSFVGRVQSALSGVARRCGWQKIGAYINLGTFYLVGVLVSIILAFIFHLKTNINWAMVGDCSHPSSTNGIVSSHYSRDRLGERGKSLPILEGRGLLNFLFILHFSLNSSLWGNSTHFSFPI